MATFSLGPFTFKVLESVSGRGGAPTLPQVHTEIVQRPGVEGTAFIDLASKGDVFQMRSLIDVTSEANAMALISAYRAVVGNQKLAMVWRDNDYDATHGVKFVAVGVTDDRIQVMSCITGGLNVTAGQSGFIVEVIWHLVPVES